MSELTFTAGEIAREEWRDVVGYEGVYAISDLGRIRRLPGTPKCRYGRFLKTYPNKGYPHVMLSRGCKIKLIGIHQLVAYAFIGKCPENMEINHIDHDPQNPRLSNLEYRTHQGNIRYAVEKGRFHSKARRKLTEQDVRLIRTMLESGRSVSAVARKFGSSLGAISAIKQRRNWKRVRSHALEDNLKTLAAADHPEPDLTDID